MNANYLELNLKRLFANQTEVAQNLRQAYRPESIELRYSREGSPVPVINRKCLHSPYDPQGESRKWVASLGLPEANHTGLIVGGLGFAYHLTELLKVFPPDRLALVEPDLNLAAAAFAARPPEVFPEGLTFVLGKPTVQAYLTLREHITDPAINFKVVEHPASVNQHPEYFHTLAGIFRAQEVARQGGFKILVVSPLYGGSLPIATYVRDALNALGHRAEILENSVFHPGMEALNRWTSNRRHQGQLRGLLATLLAEAVTARALDMGADLVLGLAQSPFTPKVCGELKKAGIRTAFWFVEDFELMTYWNGLAQHFDHYFIIQKGDFPAQLEAVGCSQHHYLPVAADPAVHTPLNLTTAEMREFGSDLSHIGAGYHNRRQTFIKLLDYDFRLWGNDWENCGPLAAALQRSGGRLSTNDCVKVFNASRINLNLHSSTYHEGINPFGDFLNPRTFEISACGGFQLVDQRSLIAESFTGDEIAAFRDVKELRELINHYLAHPEERQKIAEAGRHRVLQEHTYSHRMLEMLGVISGSDPEWAPKSGGLPTPEEIIRQAGAESELGRVMQRFQGEGPMTLEGLSAKIEHSNGDLNRTEAMILLLNEFRRWGLEKQVL
jgi:spore maturation protein CgeB